jgi:4-amino-4-deoxy-L-arabinose transferase-like glycosyltransferase
MSLGPQVPTNAARRPSPRSWIALAALVGVIVAIRLTGPSDLLDNDQLKPAAYATDVVANGQWAVQRDTSGDIASKPPLTVWIASIGALASGGTVTRFALALPAIIGLAGCAAVVLMLGTRYLGAAAAWWGVLALVLSPMGFKQAILVRTDSFYGLAGALCGWALWHGVRRGGSAWVWVWVAATIAMLTKGPVAALLPLGGLLAWVWPREPADPARPDHSGRPGTAFGWHAAGAVILVVIVGGWFFLAWRDAGDAFIDKIIRRELVGHAVATESESPMVRGFYLPTLYYLGRFAPGSILTAIALWAAVFRPSVDPITRRFERFLSWWFVAGIVVFSLAPHQRADLLTPIWVAGSVLAGRVMADLTGSMAARGRIAITAAWLALAVVGGVLEHHTHAWRKPKVRAEIAIRALAEELLARFDGPPPIVHVSDNSSLQFFLGRRVDRVQEDAALAMLAGNDPCAIAVAERSGFAARAQDRGVPVTEFARSDGPERYRIVILGNASAASMPEWSAAVPPRTDR